MKKLKEQWLKFYHNTVVFYFVIGIIICGLLALMFTLNTKNEVPLEEDTKQAEEVIKKDIEKANEEITDKLNDNYPTVEEVDRLLSSMDSESLSDYEILIGEFGSEKAKNIYFFYSNNLLISVNDNEELREMKFGQIKSYLEDSESITSYSLFYTDSNKIPIYSYSYGKKDTQVVDVGNNIKIGVGKIEEQMGVENYTKTLFLYAYPTKDMLLKEFIENTKGLKFTLNGKEFDNYNDVFLKNYNLGLSVDYGSIMLPLDSLYEGKEYLEDIYENKMLYAGTVMTLVYSVNDSSETKELVVNSKELGDMIFEYTETDYKITLTK